MMKNTMRILALLIACVIVILSLATSVNAYVIYAEYGDVDRSFEVDIFDATRLQQYLVGTWELIDDSIGACDVDADGEITIFDATMIQRYVAGIITEFPAGYSYDVYDVIHGILADCESGKAMVGIPVNFFVEGDIQPGPVKVMLFVDDVCVAQVTETDEFGFLIGYTFEKAGTYDIKVALYDKFGKSEHIIRMNDYVVIDQPLDKSQPILMSFEPYTFVSLPRFKANVALGTAPYEYEFVLKYRDDIIFIQNFSENNEFEVDYSFLDSFWDISYYTFCVTVRDANGNELTASKHYIPEEVLPGSPSPY